jgi:hypothetical protein
MTDLNKGVTWSVIFCLYLSCPILLPHTLGSPRVAPLLHCVPSLLIRKSNLIYICLECSMGSQVDVQLHCEWGIDTGFSPSRSSGDMGSMRWEVPRQTPSRQHTHTYVPNTTHTLIGTHGQSSLSSTLSDSHSFTHSYSSSHSQIHIHPSRFTPSHNSH